VKREVCAGCHTGENSAAFDYDAKLGAVNHSKWREAYKEPEYKTPFNLAVTADGERLFVACEASNSLIVIHAKTGELLAEIAIGAQPHFVCFSPDQRRAYVSNRASDSVSILDTQTYEVLSTL
jgi:YVTN family beta-propeller protein